MRRVSELDLRCKPENDSESIFGNVKECANQLTRTDNPYAFLTKCLIL